MADNFTIGVWNLYLFGTKSIDPLKDGNNRIQFIAEVMETQEVDIMFFLEVKTVAASSFLTKLIQKLGQTKLYKDRTNPWKGTHIDVKGNNESYCLMWRNDTKKLVSAAGDGSTGTTIQVLNTINKLGSTTPSGDAKYHQFSKREPGYTLFKVTQNNNNYYFFVIGWHATGSKMSARADTTWLPSLYIVNKKKSNSSSSSVALKYGFIMADFNVDADVPDQYSDYANLRNWSTHHSTSEKTHIYSNSNDNKKDKNKSKDYRNSAIDNIYTNWDINQIGDSMVDDLIDECMQGGYMYDIAKNFHPANFAYSSNRLAVMPPNTMENAFKVFRGAISDHLPVFQTITYTT